MHQQGVADNRREGGINSLMRKQAEVKTGITALWSYASVCRSNTISVRKWLDEINLYVFALYVVTQRCTINQQKINVNRIKKLESWTARKLLTHRYFVAVELTFDLWDTKQSIIPHTQLDIPLESV